MPYPAPPHYFPTKNEMADYLEAYASRFKLPVRTGVRVDRLSRQGDRYSISAGDQTFEAEHVVERHDSYVIVHKDPGPARQLHQRRPDPAAGRLFPRGGAARVLSSA